MCWQSFHKKDDEFVVDTVNGLIKQKIITHVSCIFHLLTDYCSHLLNSIKMYYLAKPIPDFEVDKMRDVLMNILNSLADNQATYKKCDQSCKKYDYKEGEEFCL